MRERITLNDILEVNELDTEDIISYYHIPSESMIVISNDNLNVVKSNIDIDSLEEWKKELTLQASDFLNNPKDYIRFPNEKDYDEENVIVTFINVYKDDKDIYNKLVISINEGISIKRFKEALFELNLIDRWYDFREKEFLKVAKNWCKKNKVKYEI